ncbi:class I lanthipeptide [Kordia sp.]|uniref:class I lanthipeptide n=1 Tax=Kordia sp. TaxID=1965332 RepID=UPI003D6B38E9
MKKKNLNSLSLNKKSISNLTSGKVGGVLPIEDDSGTSGGIVCTNYSMFNSCQTICYSDLCETKIACGSIWDDSLCTAF